MELEQLSGKYQVRCLLEDDIDNILEVCLGNELFYKYHPPMADRQSILDDMNALPPDKGYEDKYYIGFYADTELIAIMDLILKFPNEETAYIGFFMMKSNYQGNNRGTQIIQEALSYLKELGFRQCRLGIDKGNPQSEAFWTKNKFVKKPETPDSPYIVMERLL